MSEGTEINTGTTNPKKNCLILFKNDQWNCHFIIEKINTVFTVHSIFTKPVFYKKGSTGILELIKKTIEENCIEVIFLDLDWAPFVDAAILNNIPGNVIKVLITLDDIVMHDINVVHASLCDLILSADPVSVLKYREKGICAEYMPLESSTRMYYPLNICKDIDVLFYGDIEKIGRRQYIDHLIKSGINIRVIAGPGDFVSHEELINLINRAKIVLNLSRTRDFQSYREMFGKSSRDLDLVYLQLKGRIFEAALCRTVCISEYCPALDLLFLPEEVPTFTTKEECVRLITLFLGNERLRDNTALAIYQKVINTYENSVFMPGISRMIDELTIKPKPIVTNHYYKSFVTLFKLKHAVVNPGLVPGEMIYLYKNKLLSIGAIFNNASLIMRVAIRQFLKHNGKN